jgi:hypothetical protein
MSDIEIQPTNLFATSVAAVTLPGAVTWNAEPDDITADTCGQPASTGGPP